MQTSKQRSDIETRPRDQPVRLEVALARRVDDGLGQGRRWSVTIPPARPALAVQVVAQRLLVEARLSTAGLVAIGRPEPGAVGGEHLVDEKNVAVHPSELELGVGDD